jgi:signal transduction histidine kinase
MRRGRLVAVVAVAGIAIGVAAEAVSFSSLDLAVTDVVTGWTLLGCGLWACAARPGELRWPLLAAAGLAWFAGNAGDAGLGAASSAAAGLVFLHRGLLVHATVAGTTGRALAATTIAAGYADVLAVGGGATTVATAGLLLAVAATAVAGRARGATRPSASEAGAALALAAGLALAGGLELAGTTIGTARPAAHAYEGALCLTALLLASGAAREARTRAALADLVVELGPGRRSGAARDALAAALGDPALDIGYWLPEAALYADEHGRELALPAPGSGRRVTMVERDGEPVAALVHSSATLDDPAVVDAVRGAAGLVLANARLQVAAEHRLDELRASRLRLVTARDEQRRRLERRLHEGARRHLREVAGAVRDVRAASAAGDGDTELLDLLVDELAHAQEELGELARGIHPRTLAEQGLPAALAALAERAPVPVELVTPDERLPQAVETAAYFICSEALVNVAKYARATRARCEVARRDGRVQVIVADDGIGGADPGRGSGLRGLADRVEALGGELHVTSPGAGGTTVRAELPLAAPAVQGAP